MGWLLTCRRYLSLHLHCSQFGKNHYFGSLFLFLFFVGRRWGWGQALPVSLCCRDLIPVWKIRYPRLLGFKNIFYGLIESELVHSTSEGGVSLLVGGWKWEPLLVKKKNKIWVKGDAVKWGIWAFLMYLCEKDLRAGQKRILWGANSSTKMLKTREQLKCIFSLCFLHQPQRLYIKITTTAKT